jgi:hypothetical protein
MDEQQFGFAEGDPTKYVRIYIYHYISPLDSSSSGFPSGKQKQQFIIFHDTKYDSPQMKTIINPSGY